MSQPWHIARPELRAEIEQTLGQDYPDLTFVLLGDTAVVHGSFPVKDTDGELLTRFAIQITFPSNYPTAPPNVREVFARIPHVPSRHVNIDGNACLGALDEWLIVSSDHSFRAFMEGPVRNFFLGQALVERGEPWPFGERSHGVDGLLEAYAELLGLSDMTSVKPYLLLLSRHNVKGHWDCPCGSGKPLRKCHGTEFRELQLRISPTVAGTLLANLAKYGV